MIEPDIVSSVNASSLFTTEFLSVSDRYYEHKYCTKFSIENKNLDQRISFHSNRICMISLAENHPVMKDKKKVITLNCVVDKVDRLMNAASGKGKRGAQRLDPSSIVCYIECDDGVSYPVYSCVKGKLLEINQNLLSTPNLLLEKPVAEGYIALLLPVLNLYNDTKNSMLSKDEYYSSMKQDINMES